jgi:hypothetical protein
VDVEAIDKITILLTGENLWSIFRLIEGTPELITNIIEGARTDVISTLRTPIIEKRVRAQFRDSQLFLLANYYFFRKVYEENRKNPEKLHEVPEKLKLYPFMFILSDRVDVAKIKEIFNLVYDNLCFELLNYNR